LQCTCTFVVHMHRLDRREAWQIDLAHGRDSLWAHLELRRGERGHLGHSGSTDAHRCSAGAQ